MVKSKKTKEKKSNAEKGETEEEIKKDISKVELEVKKLGSLLDKENLEEIRKIPIKSSKPVAQLKKGDKVKINGIDYEIDAQYTLIDHGKTKEIAIELFNPKTDKDYQLRYFSDQLDTSLEFYELQEILYVRRPIEKIEW